MVPIFVIGMGFYDVDLIHVGVLETYTHANNSKSGNLEL